MPLSFLSHTIGFFLHRAFTENFRRTWSAELNDDEGRWNGEEAREREREEREGKKREMNKKRQGRIASKA